MGQNPLAIKCDGIKQGGGEAALCRLRHAFRTEAFVEDAVKVFEDLSIAWESLSEETIRGSERTVGLIIKKRREYHESTNHWWFRTGA